MGKPAVRQQVVGFNGSIDIVFVDADRHAHQHLLGALHNLAVDAKQVGALQGL